MNQPVNNGGPLGLVRRVLQYLGLRLDYALLRGQALASQVLSTFFAGIILLVLAGLCISFMGLALAYGLAEWLGHVAWGFLVVGLLLTGLLLLLLWRQPWLEKMLARRLEGHFQALHLPKQTNENTSSTDGEPTIGATTDERHGA